MYQTGGFSIRSDWSEKAAPCVQRFHAIYIILLSSNAQHIKPSFLFKTAHESVFIILTEGKRNKGLVKDCNAVLK